MADCEICQKLGRTYCDYPKKFGTVPNMINCQSHKYKFFSKTNEELQKTSHTKISQETSQLLYNQSYYVTGNGKELSSRTQNYSKSRVVYPIYPVYQLVYQLKPKIVKSPLTVSKMLNNF